MKNLKPPKNYREISPRCCVTCIHYISRSLENDRGDIPTEWMECERDSTGTASEEDYYRVCDYYRRAH